MGEHEQQIIEQAMEKGLKVPDRIVNQPDLMPGLELFKEAWENLNSDRLSAFELGPIPTMAILNYARYFDIEGVDAQNFLFLIRYMDNAFIKFHDKKHKAKEAAEKRRAKRHK